MHSLDESFWLAISFIIFVYFAYKPVRNSIIKLLDSRIEAIKAQLLEAKKLKDEASSLLSESEEHLSNLDGICAKMLDDSKIHSIEICNQHNKDLELWIERKKNDSINTINNRIAEANELVKQELVDTTVKLLTEYFKESKNIISDGKVAENLQK